MQRHKMMVLGEFSPPAEYCTHPRAAPVDNFSPLAEYCSRSEILIENDRCLQVFLLRAQIRIPFPQPLPHPQVFKSNSLVKEISVLQQQFNTHKKRLFKLLLTDTNKFPGDKFPGSILLSYVKLTLNATVANTNSPCIPKLLQLSTISENQRWKNNNNFEILKRSKFQCKTKY